MNYITFLLCDICANFVQISITMKATLNLIIDKRRAKSTGKTPPEIEGILKKIIVFSLYLQKVWVS
jgi:hypothetical protein